MTADTNRTKATSQAADDAEASLREGTTLRETPFAPAGLEGVLHFLGAESEFPFMMAHAGYELFRNYDDLLSNPIRLALDRFRKLEANLTVQKSEQDINCSSPLDPTHAAGLAFTLPKVHPILLEPEALALKISIAGNPFFIKHQHAAHTASDLKLEIFYNGELCESQVMCNKSDQQREIIVGSRRIAMIMSRPWVIVPPQQNADGTLHDPTSKKLGKAVAEDRWQNIGDALRLETAQRGTNEKGERAPSTDYLVALSAVSIPANLEILHRNNAGRFGVIDLIVTSGASRKGSATGNTSFIYVPHRLPDYSYPLPLSDENAKAGNDLKPTNPDACLAASSSEADTSLIASQKPNWSEDKTSSSDIDLNTKVGRPEQSSCRKPKGRVRLSLVVRSDGARNCDESITTSPVPHRPLERLNESTIGNQMQPAHSRQKIKTDAQSDAKIRNERAPAKGNLQLTQDGALGQNRTRASEIGSFSSKGEVKQPCQDRRKAASSPTWALPALPSAIRRTETIAAGFHATATPEATANLTKKVRRASVTQQQSSLDTARVDPVPQVHCAQLEWPTPILSQDSVCSYAEAGPYMLSTLGNDHSASGVSTNVTLVAPSSRARGIRKQKPSQQAPSSANGPVLRYVRSVKTGNFREVEVLLGVRYIIG